MLNLTPHPITIQFDNGQSITYPPSGTVARVETVERVIGTMDIQDGDPIFDWQGNLLNGHRVPVIVRVLGEVVGLPEEDADCIVSSMVLDACKGRRGVFAPDTGPTAIRNDKGFVTAVTRLVAAYAA